MDRQQISHQKGEIEFRRKLLRQQVEGERVLSDEYEGSEGEKILKGRMNETLAGMNRLREAGIPLSPYLEIGAERGQRSLVMENDMSATGAAADISADMLLSCDHYGALFNMPRIPMRVCCDVNNLPFRSNSLPFVFCYETLHHFPSPTPIVAELYRVICPGGYFWFDDEPYRRVLHWNLYDGAKAYSQEARKRGVVRRAFDRLFTTMTCNEVEHGVIENHEIPIAEWKNALSPFSSRDVWLQPSARLNFRARLYNPFPFLKYWVAYLMGGRIAGLCQKQPGSPPEKASIFETLICPSCRIAGKETPLCQKDSCFVCSECLRRYPVVDGVVYLFEYTKFNDLYPEIFQSLRSNSIEA
jgi:SAM-dependent methyltransferase